MSPVRRRSTLRDQHAILLEAHVLRGQIDQRADEQAGAEHEDERDGDLQRDQPMTEVDAAAARRPRRASGRAARAAGVSPVARSAGATPNSSPVSTPTSDREAEHAPVEREVERDDRRARRDQLHERAAAPDGEQDAGGRRR